MKNIISIAIMGSVICISDMSASTICPREIGDSDLRSLNDKKPVTINSIELTNRGDIYTKYSTTKANLKSSDFTNNKDEELCTYNVEGEKKSFTVTAKGILPKSGEEVGKKPSILPRALSRAQ